MARYIDEKDVYALVEPRGVAKVHCSQIDELPRADVVPKSEVEFLRKTIAENAQRSLEVTLEEIEKTKAEVAREIFEEIENFTHRYLNDPDYSGGDLIYDFNELKKKYTEGDNE